MSTIGNDTLMFSSRKARMSSTGSERLRSSFSSSKLRMEHNVSVSEMNVGEKKRKVSFSTPVEMETENHEALLEPVVAKKMRTTGNGHSFKAKFMGKRKDKIVPVKLALGQTEKHTSNQEKEQVQSVSSKEGCLQRMHKQGSLNTIYSGSDHLVSGKNINQESSNVNDQRAPSSSVRLKILKRNIVKDSAEEEHNENQILSQQKQALNDKGADSRIDSFQKDSHKKEHDENQILSQQKQALNNKGADSRVDCFQKDSYKKEHTENQILSQQRQAEKDKGAGSEINSFGKNSAKEEHYEKQIRPEQKQAVKDKDAGRDVCHLLNKMQKKCRKRMAKLIQKQQEQTQDFHQIWEKKRSDLVRKYKLELSVIQSIHGEDATRTNYRLKLLDGKFAKKMKEHNLLKDAELKKLETEQLSAVEEERRQEAHWLALCYSGEPMADHGPESLGLNSEEVGCDAPLGNLSNSLSTDPHKELGVAFSQTSVLAGVKQPDQLKNLCPDQIICALPASTGGVSGKIGAVKLNKEFPPEGPEAVCNEIGDCAYPVELSNSTNKGIDKGDAIGLPDALVNLGDENDEADGLPLIEQILEASEQTKASWSPHHCTSSLSQASEDQITCSSVSNVIQDIGAKVVEAQNTSPFEVAILQSDIELQDQNVPTTETQSTSEIATTGITDRVTPEESIVKAPVLEDQHTWQIENTNSERIGSVNPIQDQSAQVVEKQKASSFEVAASVQIDTVTVVQPNIELHDQDDSDTSRGGFSKLDTIDITHEEISENFQDQDASVLEDQATSQVEVINSEPIGIVNPVQSIVAAPAIQNCEELVSINASPCWDQPPSIAVESQSQSQNLERSSIQTSQTAEIEGSVVVSCEFASQSGGNREPQSNHLDIRSERNSYPTVEITDTVLLSSESTSQLWGNQEPPNNHFGMGSESQVNVNVSQIVVNTVEPPHQAGLQLGSAGNLYGCSNPFSDRQATSLSSPPSYAAPLQHVLGKISEEIEQLQKCHEDRKSQLKSDREKEMQENLAQIKNKYYAKLQVAEAEFSCKKNVLAKNRNKVFVNKLLAESFSASCEDLCWPQGIQQGAPSNTMQYFQH